MESKLVVHVLYLILLVSLFEGFKSEIAELPFCHEQQMERAFLGRDVVENSLMLNASYKAIGAASFSTSQTEVCTCTVTAIDNVSRLYMDIWYSQIAAVTSNCKKRIDVTDDSGTILQTFDCTSKAAFELGQFETGKTINIHLRAMADTTLASPDADRIVLYIAPDTESKLRVKCGAPYIPVGSGATLTNDPLTTTTPTPPTTTTIKVFKPQSSDTMVIAGVVVGLGLVFLVLITCLLFYIARRNKRDDTRTNAGEVHAQPPQIQQVPPKLQTRFHHRLRRTMTIIYDKIKARPLPSIPKSFKRPKLTPDPESGIYSSIRSDINQGLIRGNISIAVSRSAQVKTQESCQSTISYLQPSPVPSKHELPDIINDIDDAPDYINPVNTETVDGISDVVNTVDAESDALKDCDKLDSETDYVNTVSCCCTNDVYINCNIHPTIDTIGDTNIAGDEGSDDVEAVKLKHLKDTTVKPFVHRDVMALKHPLMQVDSHGYVPMKSTMRQLLCDKGEQLCEDKINEGRQLRENKACEGNIYISKDNGQGSEIEKMDDELFPRLIRFEANDDEMTEGVREGITLQSEELDPHKSDGVEKVKNKRYVRQTAVDTTI